MTFAGVNIRTRRTPNDQACAHRNVAYATVQPVAFSCSVRRVAIVATMDRKRAGLALVESSLTLAGDMKKSAGDPSYCPDPGWTTSFSFRWRRRKYQSNP